MIDYYLDLFHGAPPLIHSAKCKNLLGPEFRKYLGLYMGPEGALFEAKKYNKNVKLCEMCKKDHMLRN